MLYLPLEQKLEIIKRGEDAAGVPKIKAIKERGAFPECVPTLEALEPNIQEAIATSIVTAARSKNISATIRAQLVLNQ
mgnify:FL=1